MSLLNLFLIAIALSFDAIAVSAAAGAHDHRMSFPNAFRLAFLFGLFQWGMPLLGWLIGTQLEKFISNFDHWIAFFLLAAIGGKMIHESFNKTPEKKTDLNSWKILLILAIATSIDAMATGLTFAFIQVPIYTATLIIGLTTFTLSLSAVYLGKKCGEHWGKKTEIIGGLILIAIGLKILLSHLL
ncbi:MAG: manganese efflux pump MntP family protein [Candidatus Gracilibacteria bacterium]